MSTLSKLHNITSISFRSVLTNAIVDPWAVMIKDLNAVVANRAVAAAGRAVELAGDAPLHPHLDGVVRNNELGGNC